MPIKLCLHPNEARNAVLAAKRAGKKVGVVPTMGALHQGHLSLVKASATECEYNVVTIFVNPTQFGPNEDFEKYPRDLDQDLAMLEDLGVNLVFAPNTDEIYSPTHSTYVEPPAVAKPLEGELRPGHFRGVTTIVLKLFQSIPADVAFFGQKDYQQTRVIEDMVADLDIPVSVQVRPIIRETDGLALSSRNAYLSDEERQRAMSISQALRIAVEMSRTNANDASQIKAAMVAHMEREGVDSIDYATIVDRKTLMPVDHAIPGSVVLIAAYVGKTRLIDNVTLG